MYIACSSLILCKRFVKRKNNVVKTVFYLFYLRFFRRFAHAARTMLHDENRNVNNQKHRVAAGDAVFFTLRVFIDFSLSL